MSKPNTASYQVVVIGAGPGGYVAAIRCAQLGLKTAIVEKYNTLGGTCLNVGCIPSKALLDSSEHYHNARAHFQEHGISVGSLAVNFEQMIARKNQLVGEVCKGVDFLMKKNHIDRYAGHGRLLDARHVQVKGPSEATLAAEHIILATGSKPTTLPFIRIDKTRIITSTEALSLKEVPKHMVLIGGGVIGLELGSVYARLGTRVEVVEYLDRIIGTMDETMGKALLQSLKKLGIVFHLAHQVTGVVRKGEKVVVEAKMRQNDKKLQIETDYCLVAVGRSPYTEGLGLDKVGISQDKGGRIEVNARNQTAIPNIYAIGDVVRGAMLAHKAEEEGVMVAEQIAGQKPHIHYLLIPSVVYTWPEVASVGHTEAALKAQGRSYKVGQFPFKALGRARASGDTDGLIKVLADAQSDELLGVHMIGARTADMIAEAVLAMEFRATAEDISRVSHAHPTYTEAFREACLAATAKRALHV